MNIPLLYVLCEPTVPTEAVFDTTYKDSDEQLMACIVLQGNKYKQDNAQVWDILCPLIYGTPAWDYMKACDKKQDGCKAF
jgi:hypothetical protein